MKRKVSYLILGLCTLTILLLFVLNIKYIENSNGNTFYENNDISISFSSLTLFLSIVFIIVLILFFFLLILRNTVDEEVIRRKNQDTTMKHTFCPQCGSSDIGFWIPQLYSVYRCKQCGYQGSIIVEDGLLAQKIKNDYLND